MWKRGFSWAERKPERNKSRRPKAIGDLETPKQVPRKMSVGKGACPYMFGERLTSIAEARFQDEFSRQCRKRQMAHFCLGKGDD